MITLREKTDLIKKGKLKAKDNLSYFLKKIKEKNKELNIFLSFNENCLKEAEEIDKKIFRGEDVGKLSGICFAVKSNICVEGLETNCASFVLKNWIAPYNSTVVEKLKKEDAIIIGMVNMDEFACGGSGETSAFGPTKNPLNQELIPGGSSSGSAAAVAADFCDFALGSDTGGSIRNPASHCGIFGLKPTYGSVSRYGLIDMCMSFDQIGPLTKNIEDVELIFSIIKGKDEKDATTKEEKEKKLDTKNIRIGLVNVEKFAAREIKNLIEEKVNNSLKKNSGWKIKEVYLPLEISLETYYLLVYVEFFSATRKFDGRRFGKKIEEFCGEEVLRRITGGKEITKAEYEGKYYRNALRAKEFIKKQFEEIFKDVDVIVLPTVPRTAHKIGEKISVEEMYSYDVFTTLANIAGIPAISIPCGYIDKKAVGMQILAPHFCENWIFEFVKKLTNLP
ncbi:MAG: Asp-tRNA(Asn)/Glu-tRNA(Gln) amidotransferase subunit GatA [Candidatus Pacearchaeota archaeon]